MMVKTQLYDKPPITEAIIDLRVVSKSGLRLEVLEELCESDKNDFPRIDSMVEATGKIQFKPEGSPSASANQVKTGFRSISTDGKLVCQRQLRGFTFSRLEPYGGWVPFRNLARSSWGVYREKTAPQSVTRLAVRYVNRIDVPSETVEMTDYFRTFPEISPDLPQSMNGFFMQVRIPQDDIGAKVVINQTIVPPPEPGVTSFVLDIDIYRDESVPGDDNAIWAYFETLHSCKNKIFEACITDRARELFK